MQLEPVGSYVFGPDVYDGADQVIARHELPAERLAEFFDLIEAWADGKVELVHLPEIIGEAFGLDAEKAKVVTRDLVGYCMLPLERYYKGIPEQLVAWGGKVGDYPDFRVPKEHLTVDQYAGRVTEQLGLSLQPVYIKRLGFLVREYVEEKKDREKLLMFFQRPVAIGGLGLSAEESAKVMEAVDAERNVLEFVDEEPVVVATPEPDLRPAQKIEPEPAPVLLPEIAPSHAVATSTPMAAKPPVAVVPAVPKAPPRTSGDTAADAAEIAKHEKLMVKKGVAATGDARLEAAVAIAVAAATATLTKKKIAPQQFAEAAELTMKGVRDPYQTRAILERDHGVAGEDLVQLLEAIMLGLEEYHKKAPGPVALPQTQPDVASEERKVLDQRFAAVAGTLSKEKIEPVMPSARVSAARTKEEEVAVQAAQVDVKKLEAATAAAKPEPAKAMLTVGSVPPPAPGEQKVLTDVQFRPKLVGPVEELGTMAPADFRRLSSNPSEAAKKIEDVLANLEATSYEDRIRGVQAWRKSPVNALYTQMAAEALQDGVALAEVASRRRNKGQESLSPAEMKAIASINARIQF